jgi:hypothetical protein
MANLISDKNTAKLFVDINFINNVSSLPDFGLAAERFLIPIIGQDLYDALADDMEDPSDPDLLYKCRAVIAPLAYLIKLPTIQTQLTDSGLRTISTENMQAAHRWEYNEVKENLADKGAWAIEALLKFLYANKGDYSEWTDSEEYAELSDLIFLSGSDFTRYFTLHHPHRVFWSLRTLIKEVEDFYIISAIGKDFFKTLKETEAPEDEVKDAIILIKKAVAQYTIVKAIEKFSVKVSDRGFTIKALGAYSEGTGYDDQVAPDPQLDLLYKSCERTGDAYLVQLKEFLNKNASAELFEEYYDSDKYTAPPTTDPESRNANRKLFGFN